MRLVLFVLPPAVVATAGACSSPDDPAPFTTVRSESGGDQELQRELSWTAAVVARCNRGGTGPGCTGGSDGQGMRPANLRPSAGEIIPGLPTKDIVCSIARTLLDGAKDFAIGEINGGASDASSGEAADAATAEDASQAPAGQESADGGTRSGTRPFFFHGGPIDEVDAGGHGVADVVWDLERAEAAVFFHAGGGVGGAAAIEGAYDGTATGTSTDLIAAWRGPVVNTLGADAGGTRLVRHLQSSVLSVPQAAAKGPLLPALLTPTSAAGYEPWDLATEALAGRLTAAHPKIEGEAGRRVLRWSAGGDASAPSPASAMAVNMMTAAGDRGDFATRAGRAALVAIANGVARAAGLGLDRWCGGEGGGAGVDASAEAATPASCIAEPSRCGAGAACLWNGPEDGFCCRPHATGETYCTAGDSACGAGEICTQRSDERFVCAAKETCR